MDVIHLVEIDNGDHLKAVPLPRSVTLKDSHKKVTVSRLTSLGLCLLVSTGASCPLDIYERSVMHVVSKGVWESVNLK